MKCFLLHWSYWCWNIWGCSNGWLDVLLDVPNSGRGLPRLDYRTKEWDVDFRNYLKKLDATKPVILCGDLNVAHHEIGIFYHQHVDCCVSNPFTLTLDVKFISIFGTTATSKYVENTCTVCGSEGRQGSVLSPFGYYTSVSNFATIHTVDNFLLPLYCFNLYVNSF